MFSALNCEKCDSGRSGSVIKRVNDPSRFNIRKDVSPVRSKLGWMAD